MSAEARAPSGLASLPTERLIAFAWEMADLIDASVYAKEPESPWRLYARALEKQAHEEVRMRTKEAAE
jgi:hypothetical protein